MLVLLVIVGVIFRNDPGGAWNKITEQMSYFLDKNAVEVVQNIAQKAAQPNKSLLATIIGILRALFGASGVFGQLQDAEFRKLKADFRRTRWNCDFPSRGRSRHFDE